MRQYNDIRLPKGFTLIELLIVVAVLGIVSGGILIALNIGGVIGKASLTKAKKFAAQLERGLVISQVGKWSFEDGTGATIAKDTSGYGNDGMVTGGATWNDATTCGLGFGGCMSFDGTDDYVNGGAGSSLDITAHITIAVWVKMDDAGTDIVPNQYFISKGTGAWNDAANNTYLFFISNEDGVSGDSIEFRLSDGTSLTGTNNVDGLQMDDFKPDTWYHLVATWDGTTMKIYKNGSHISGADVAFTGPIKSLPSAILNIGRLGDNSRYFDGLIDEVQIYNEALTLSQIQRVYALGLLRKEISLRF